MGIVVAYFSEAPGKVHIILKLYFVWLFNYDVLECLPYLVVFDLLCCEGETQLDHVLELHHTGLVFKVLGHFLLQRDELLGFLPALLFD